MIYTAQLYAGDWYVLTTTNAPERERYAVRALPQTIFADPADAKQAARIAADWADKNRWRIVATDRATGEEFDCFIWTRDPWAGLQNAMETAKLFKRDCYRFRALPA